MNSCLVVLMLAVATANAAVLSKVKDASCDGSQVMACNALQMEFMQTPYMGQLLAGIATGSFVQPVKPLVDTICSAMGNAISCMKTYYDRCHPEYSQLFAIGVQSMSVCQDPNFYSYFESGVRCIKAASLTPSVLQLAQDTFLANVQYIYQNQPTAQQIIDLSCTSIELLRQNVETAVVSSCTAQDAHVMGMWVNYANELYGCPAKH